MIVYVDNLDTKEREWKKKLLELKRQFNQLQEIRPMLKKGHFYLLVISVNGNTTIYNSIKNYKIEVIFTKNV